MTRWLAASIGCIYVVSKDGLPQSPTVIIF